MKERPILFTPDNAQKSHDGTKTQTRRIVKHIPDLGGPEDWCESAVVSSSSFHELVGDYCRYCPYGEPGSRLWVREAWQQICVHDDRTICLAYKGAQRPGTYGLLVQNIGWPEGLSFTNAEPLETIDRRWRPAIYMPRWACRTVLEITEIRVERLQDIREEDAKAEGSAVVSYSTLWESIHGSGSWDENPWVWVIRYKRLVEELWP